MLFNDALNTFYLRLYGVRHVVKDHSDSERGNPLPPHGLLFPIRSKGSLICIIPQTGSYIPRPLLHQSCSTGWNEKLLNGSSPWRIDPTTHHTVSERSYHGATSRSLYVVPFNKWLWMVIASPGTFVWALHIHKIIINQTMSWTT